MIPLAGVRFESAQINGVNISLAGDNDQCSGDVTFLYNDLKLQILKIEEGDTMKDRKLLSFLAGEIFMKHDNTLTDKNEDPKVVSYQRDPQKGFFNLIWKTIFEGVRETVQGTRLDELARKIKKKQEARQEESHEQKERKHHRKKDKN